MFRRRISLFMISSLASVGSLGLSLVNPTYASHRSVHDEYRERIRELECWRRDALESLRCEFDREHDRLERALREARRNCRTGRIRHDDHDGEVARIEHALDDLHHWYDDARNEVQDEYRCKRRDIDTWYRSAKKMTSASGRRPVRAEFRPHTDWPERTTWHEHR
jgi:hypothetical protein